MADISDRARAILRRLEGETAPQARPAPVFIEFSGTPKSGKSTCIDIISHFFRRMGFRVLAPTEGASKRVPYYLKDDLVAFNTWSASYALMHVLEGLNHADRYHLAILDRGIFDALAWFERLAANDEIDTKTRDIVQQFLLVDKWRSAIDLVFLFSADPETALEREQKDKLTSEPGRAMNREFLQSLNDSYSSVRSRFKENFPNFIDVDTSGASGSTPKSTAESVGSSILDILEAKV